MLAGRFGSMWTYAGSNREVGQVSAAAAEAASNGLAAVVAHFPVGEVWTNGAVSPDEALTKAGVPLFAYGNFITVAINFIILAFIIFLMVKQINRLKRDEPKAPAPPAEDVVLLREIRDSLKPR